MNPDSSENTLDRIDSRLYLLGLFGSFIFAYLVTMLVVHHGKLMILDREYSMWLYVKKVTHSASQSHQDLIVVGDSRAKAGYIPNLTNRRTLNLAFAGQTPIEGYYLLSHYLKNNPAPNYLVVSYAPFHLSVADAFWEMTVKYGFLDSDEYNEVLETSSRLKDTILGEKDKRWQYLFLPNTYWESMRRAIKEHRWRTNEETYASVVNSRGHYYYGKESGTTEPNQEIKLGTFVISRLLDLYLMKLIDLAHSRHIAVFWYTMPFSETSCKKLSVSYKRDFERYLFNLESRTGIEVIERIACLSDSLFGDSNHVYLGAHTTTLAILNGVFLSPCNAPSRATDVSRCRTTVDVRSVS